MNNEYLIVNVPLDMIDENPFQTRQQVPHEHIGNLVSSIRANGLKQRPQGRPVDADGLLIPYTPGCRIQLAFGHNRHKAFYLLSGMFEGEYDTMPIEIVSYNDEEMALAAWVENDDRKQLNPVERAKAILNFINTFNWTQAQVAEKVRLERSTVANLLRLLTLPEALLNEVADGNVSQRQAAALIPFYELTKTEQDAWNEDKEFNDFLCSAWMGQVNSDTIREKVAAAIAIIHPAPPQFDFTATEEVPAQIGESPDQGEESPLPPFIEGEQNEHEQPGWLQKTIEGDDVPPLPVETPLDPSEAASVIAPVIPADQPQIPALQQAGQPILAADPPAIQAAPPSTPTPNSGAVQASSGTAPTTWAESTYSLTIGYQAEDGNENGRLVIISARRNQDTPQFYQMREKSINLPWQLVQMINKLNDDAQASEEGASNGI